MQNYVYLLVASFLLAADFAVQKIYQKKSGTGIIAGLSFNTVVGLGTAVLFFILNGFTVHITSYALIMAGTMSIFAFIYTLIGFRILRDGNMAVYSLFLMTGGMVVPYIFGTIFLEEQPTKLNIVGVILILFAVILPNLNIKNVKKTQLILCVAVLLLNGGCSVFSKLGQVDFGYGIIGVYDFVCITGIVKFVACGGVLAAYLILRKNKTEKPVKISVIPIMCISFVVGGVSYMLQLIGAATLPASLMFPMVSGGSMIFSTITGMIMFKEKPTKLQVIGVSLCFVGTLFLM